MFTAVYAITFAAMSAGNNAHFMPDVAQTNNAAANLFLILDSEDEEQMQAREESKMIKEGVNGDIEFRNISFKYESRTERVFDALSFRVRYGSKVALVGASGCGKSTIIQMLLRYYSPDEGEILINGINIKDFDIHYLRQSFGVVSQEPVLFNGSFR
jgi:ATP-binding cassette subfamily B (MDR/TAP) protein 1